MPEVIKDSEELTIIKDIAEVSIPLTDKEYSDISRAMIETMGQKADLQGDIYRLKQEFEKNKAEIEPMIDEKDDSIQENLTLLRNNSKRSQEEAEFHYNWKENKLTVFRKVEGKNGFDLVELPGYGREIRSEERQTLLPLEIRVAITGNAADGHSVMIAGKPLETDGAPFTWGKKITPGSLSLANSILAAFGKEEDANQFAGDFCEEFLCKQKTSEDFVFELDVGKWISWKRANPNTDKKE